jgi:hypothetical protein
LLALLLALQSLVTPLWSLSFAQKQLQAYGVMRLPEMSQPWPVQVMPLESSLPVLTLLGPLASRQA